jgi:hypothetical protein
MSKFVSALDLGQVTDYSAFIIAECSTIPDPDPDRKGYTMKRYDVRHIQRWELGTKYTQIVEDLKTCYSAKPNLPHTKLLVDATGCGRPVVDMLRDSTLMASVRAYTITHGFTEGEFKDRHGTVPKLHLCGVTQAAVQQRRVRYADGLRLGPVLEKEMETFQVKVTETRNETFPSWREKDHDDLVLALALIIWYGERHGCGDWSGPIGPTNTISEQIAERVANMRMRAGLESRIYPSYFPKYGTGW